MRLGKKLSILQRSASNESQVALSHVQPSATGKYSCEVSADAPSFHTEIATKDLEVVGKYWHISYNFFFAINLTSSSMRNFAHSYAIIQETHKRNEKFQKSFIFSYLCFMC